MSPTGEALRRMPRMLHGLIRSPRRTLAEVAARGAARDGLVPVLGLGLLYAALVLLLYLRGHAPSVTLIPIPREDYYLWEALFVTPLFVLLWLVYGALSHALCRLAGGVGSFEATLAVTGLGYAVPIAVLFVVPDLAVSLAWGHAALAKAMRCYAPGAVVGSVALCAMGLRAAHEVRRGAAVGIALLGFIVQAALGGLVLR